jgi:hypothetical protein
MPENSYRPSENWDANRKTSENSDRWNLWGPMHRLDQRLCTVN